VRLAVIESAPTGGLLHYAAQLADALAARGHDVDLITARGNELAGRLQRARMRGVLVAPVPRPAEPPSGWRYALRRARIAGRLVRSRARTAWELARGRYDAAIVVDDLDLTLTAAAVLALTWLPRRPALAAVCHEPRPRTRWAGRDIHASSPALLAVLRLLYARLDVVFVHGERSREQLLDAFAPRRVAVIPHGDERLVGGDPPPPSSEERILFFGDWRRAKGLHELTAAFETVARRRPAARLTIAGTPTPDGDPQRVRRWAALHADRVELIDAYVPLDSVPELFARARVVATPYLAGSQSGVLHLAMTMERAVVTSDVGELGRTVVDGETGRVVPAGDVEALAAALADLLADRELAARMGREARRRLLAGASWERVAERAEAELSAAAGAGRRRRRSRREGRTATP
jgi:glycosyltransferase involved in cell wall biosynthesis